MPAHESETAPELQFQVGPGIPTWVEPVRQSEAAPELESRRELELHPEPARSQVCVARSSGQPDARAL